MAGPPVDPEGQKTDYLKKRDYNPEYTTIKSQRFVKQKIFENTFF